MISTRLIPIFVLIGLAASCRPANPSAEPTVPPAPTATVAPIISPPTATSTPRPTTSATTTNLPPTLSGTPDVFGTVIAAQAPHTILPLESPDGQWRAEVAIYDCAPAADQGEFSYEELRLVHLADGGESAADSQQINCGGLGTFGFVPVYWSPNSKFLYYSDARQGVPDGCGYWAGSMIRLEVASLARQPLGGAIVSPDGAKLAAWEESGVVIWDADKGEAIGHAPATLPAGAHGPIAWSLDSRSLVFLEVASFCPLSGKSTVTETDLAGKDLKVLVESVDPTFGGVAWEKPGQLRLTDLNGDEWVYDLASGKLKKAQ